jgi:hypothetical protein
VSSSQETMLPSHPTDANGLGIVRNVGSTTYVERLSVVQMMN